MDLLPRPAEAKVPYSPHSPVAIQVPQKGFISNIEVEAVKIQIKQIECTAGFYLENSCLEIPMKTDKIVSAVSEISNDHDCAASRSS